MIIAYLEVWYIVYT